MLAGTVPSTAPRPALPMPSRTLRRVPIVRKMTVPPPSAAIVPREKLPRRRSARTRTRVSAHGGSAHGGSTTGTGVAGRQALPDAAQTGETRALPSRGPEKAAEAGGTSVPSPQGQAHDSGASAKPQVAGAGSTRRCESTDTRDDGGSGSNMPTLAQSGAASPGNRSVGAGTVASQVSARTAALRARYRGMRAVTSKDIFGSHLPKPSPLDQAVALERRLRLGKPTWKRRRRRAARASARRRSESGSDSASATDEDRRSHRRRRKRRRRRYSRDEPSSGASSEDSDDGRRHEARPRRSRHRHSRRTARTSRAPSESCSDGSSGSSCTHSEYSRRRRRRGTGRASSPTSRARRAAKRHRHRARRSTSTSRRRKHGSRPRSRASSRGDASRSRSRSRAGRCSVERSGSSASSDSEATPAVRPSPRHPRRRMRKRRRSRSSSLSVARGAVAKPMKRSGQHSSDGGEAAGHTSASGRFVKSLSVCATHTAWLAGVHEGAANLAARAKRRLQLAREAQRAHNTPRAIIDDFVQEQLEAVTASSKRHTTHVDLDTDEQRPYFGQPVERVCVCVCVCVCACVSCCIAQIPSLRVTLRIACPAQN